MCNRKIKTGARVQVSHIIGLLAITALVFVLLQVKTINLNPNCVGLKPVSHELHTGRLCTQVRDRNSWSGWARGKWPR